MNNRYQYITPDLRNDIKDALAKLDGSPPYDNPSNFCWNDSYYMKDIERRFNMSIDDMRNLIKSIKKQP